MIDITFCIVCAVVGFVWIYALTQDGELFGWLHILNKYLPYSVLKPFLHCSVCCTGQIAFWLGFYWFPKISEYSILVHLINVFMSIYFAYVFARINAILERIIDRM